MLGSIRGLRLAFLLVLVWVAVYNIGCRGIVGEGLLQRAQPAGLPTITLSASPDSVANGGTATLSWKIDTAVSASLDGIGNVALTGSQEVTPTATTTYKIASTGHDGHPTAT